MKDILINVDPSTGFIFKDKTVLGINNENLQGNIEFYFKNEFINGVAWLEYERENEKGYIPMEQLFKEVENGKDEEGKTIIDKVFYYSIPIKSSLLSEVGKINFQLRITEDENIEGIPVFKSNKFFLEVKEAINSTEEIKDDYPEVIDVLNNAVNKANNLNIEATKVDTTTTITITKKDGSKEEVKVLDGEKGEKGVDGLNGKDGYTPIKGVDYFDGKDGKNGSFEDLTPEQKASLKGEKGEKGERGEQGLKGEKGERGEQGLKGEKGERGETGSAGKDGLDGKTPVKGIDYFTNDDIASLNIPSKTSQLENDSNFSNFSGDYNDLINKPEITGGEQIFEIFAEKINNSWTYITQKNNDTINKFMKKFVNNESVLLVAKGYNDVVTPCNGMTRLSGKEYRFHFIYPDTYSADYGSPISYRQIDISYVDVKYDEEKDIYYINSGSIGYDPTYLLANKYKLLTPTNTYQYTPTEDYNPTTKKYVDELIASSSGSTSRYEMIEVPIFEELFPDMDDIVQGREFEELTEYEKITMQKIVDVLNKGQLPILLTNDVDTPILFPAIPTYLLEEDNQTIDIQFTGSMITSGVEQAPTFNVYNLRIDYYIYKNNGVYEANNEQNSTSYNISETVNRGNGLMTFLNKIEYTPTTDYNPATKKYVDDKIGEIDTVLATLVNVEGE